MSKFLKVLFPSLFLILLCGCVPWQYIDKSDISWKHSGLEARLPTGWVRHNVSLSLLSLTKDGFLLQEIRVNQRKMNSEKEFPITKRKITEDMLIHEIAELFINEISLNRDEFLNFEVLENAPVKISDADAFKIVYTYNDTEFKKNKGIYYGFLSNKKFYSITYIAAHQHYFDKDLADFEWFMDNFRIDNKR